MKALICGSRNWTDRDRIRRVLERLYAKGYRYIVHGANGYDQFGRPSYAWRSATVRGADMLASEEAESLGFVVLSYPADWNKHGKAAGPVRNQLMLDAESPDLVVAFHEDIDSSRGTIDMVRRATKAGIPVYIRGTKVHDVDNGGRHE
jgi:hypothetical protein